MNWESIANPPFPNLVFQEAKVHAWHTLKQKLLLGATVTGTIFTRAPFGVFFDAGFEFPALLKIVDAGNVLPVKWPEDYPALGSSISGQLLAFDDHTQQLLVRKADGW